MFGEALAFLEALSCVMGNTFDIGGIMIHMQGFFAGNLDNYPFITNIGLTFATIFPMSVS